MTPKAIQAIGSFTLILLVLSVEAQDAVEPARYDAITTPVVITTSDGIELFGDFAETDKSKPIVLLFHQARSNARGEYETILPRLVDRGFNVLAVDQRSGGSGFDNQNRTIENMEDEYAYCEVYPDLEGALDHVLAAGFTEGAIVWGSSYSAALVIQLAQKRSEDVIGVLAFSPASGGPMSECRSEPYFPDLKVPLMILRPQKEMEIPSVQGQFELAQEHGHTTFVAENGVHGSSMLVESRVEGSTEPQWEAVLTFLSSVR